MPSAVTKSDVSTRARCGFKPPQKVTQQQQKQDSGSDLEVIKVGVSPQLECSFSICHLVYHTKVLNLVYKILASITDC